MISPTLTRIGFTQGVKTSSDPSNVPTDALWEARNVRADLSGVLHIRDGVNVFLPSLGNGTIQGARSSFGDILMAWNRSLYRVNSSGVSTLIRQSYLGVASTDDVKMIRWARSGAEMDYLFAGNGIFQTDGSTSPLVTPYTPQAGESTNLLRATDGTQDLTSGPAKCKYAVLKASLSQRLAIAGTPSSPNTVYLSAPLDATYWPANQVIQLPDDGSVITGLCNWYGALVIFRDRDIWAFFGSDATDTSALLVLQESTVGCVSDRSIVAVPEMGIVFLGPDNIYALQGVTGIEKRAQASPIGDDIRKYLQRAMSYGLGGVCATYFNREYRICFPDGVEPERAFRLNLQNQAGWYMDTGPLVSKFIEYNGKLYGASRNYGMLYQFDDSVMNDNGQSIPIYVDFRRESLGYGPARLKRVFIYVICTETLQNLDCSVVVDGGQVVTAELHVQASANADFVIGQSSIGQGSIGRMDAVKIYEAKFRPSLKGHFAQVRVSSTQANQRFSILGYGLEFDSNARIRGNRDEVTS